MYEYYVEKSETETGAHVVHKETCAALPAKEGLHLIGVRSTTAAPLKEAANWYGKSAPCPDCMTS